MKIQVFFSLVFLILLNFTSAVKAQDARLLAKSIFPSVVMLEMRDDKDRPISLGSGFFVRPDVVATNYHVIEGASDGFAKIVGAASIYHIEGVVGIDKTKDLALLKLKGVTGKPLILADISRIEVGQEIFALGNPKGLEGTISPGIISGNSIRTVGDENLIQITAAISPGSSGGPVVNRRGEVIGVAVSSLTGGQSLNFAVPSSYLALLLAKSRSTEPLSTARNALSEKVQPDSEPSLAETTAWLVEKLLGRSGLYGQKKNITEANQNITFNNCTMTFTRRTELGPFKDLETYVIQFDKAGVPVLSDRVKYIHIFDFGSDNMPLRKDSYENGRLVSSNIERDAGPTIIVGDEDLRLRVFKAFKQVEKLCRQNTKKEPFD